MTATCTAAKTCLPTLDEAGACMTGVEGMTGTDPIAEIGSGSEFDGKIVLHASEGNGKDDKSLIFAAQI